METEDVEELRSRIAKEIGRDSVLITSDDTQRHFDGLGAVAYYGGALFLAFVTAAGKRLWDKAKDAAGKAGEQTVDSVWDKVAQSLSGASDDSENDTDTKQIDRIKQADKSLRLLNSELHSSYVESFLDAGRTAVEARLKKDHFSQAKAKRIASALAVEVRQRMADGGA